MRLRLILYDVTTILLVSYYAPVFIGSLVLRKLRSNSD